MALNPPPDRDSHTTFRPGYSVIRTIRRTRSRWGAFVAANFLALIALSGTALAAVDPAGFARTTTPLLTGPAAGEQVVETAIHFAFEKSRDAEGARIVISRRPFDPAGWREIPPDAELTVAPAPRGHLSLSETGIRLDADTPLYWAVAVRDARTGELRMSEVRTVNAVRRFANRIAASPYLKGGTRGKLERSVVAAGAPRPAIRLGSGYTIEPDAGAPIVPAELSSAREPRDERPGALRAFLVQFNGTPAEAARDRIAAAGGVITSYIPDRAYLVRMTDAARAKLELSGDAPWVGAWEPAYKMSPRIDRAEAVRASFTALVFADADLAEVQAAVLGMGGTDVQTYDNGINRKIRFSLEPSAIAPFAALPSVAWIEPSPRYELGNENAQWVVQTGLSANRRVWSFGITGQNQVVMTSDSGIRVSHDQFRDPALALPTFGDYPLHRKVIAYKLGSDNPAVTFGDHSGASYHGTHTAGTIAGNDDPTTNTSLRDGMAKSSKIYFMDISGTTLANSVAPFEDLNDLLLPSYLGNTAGAARISSNSWGDASAAGAYTLNSMELDQFTFAHPDYLVSFSNGNAGTPGSVGSPATAKNCISMGGTGNGASQTSIYSSTSRGPADDGRRKPTVCAPGNGVVSAGGGSNVSYVTLSGTSMSSPAGSGAVVLMRQYLTDGWYPTGAAVPANGFSPSAALLKAMAVNSGQNSVSGFTTPDNNIGWGRITADDVLYFAGDARKLVLVDDTDGIQDGEYMEYSVNVADGAQPLEVSLVWSDRPGSPASLVQLINDLDLVVTNGVSTYIGNVYSGGNSALGGARDSLNVEEAVRIAAPAAGVWKIRINGANVALGPQPFALCITGGIAGNAAALAIDRAQYGTTATLEVEVVDGNASPPVQVSISSTTESTPELLTLTGGNGIYTGTISLAPTLPAADGTLSVSAGDVVTVVYSDASPASTLTTTGSVLADTPVITNVAANAAGAGAVLITWDTDRPATSRVYYNASAPLTSIVDSSGTTRSHAVLITGLTSGSTYLYDVQSTGVTGAVAHDSLGGEHRAFTVASAGDVLMVLGDPADPANSAWINALDALGYDYDVWSGSLADNALVSGLRDYSAVLWQVGSNTYPPFSDLQRASIDSLMNRGGRIAVTGHDIGWGLADPASPGYSAARQAWFENTLKSTFLADPDTWTSQLGIAADPVTGTFTGGIPYTPYGAARAGDEVGLSGAAGTTGAFIWNNNELTPAPDGIRWESPTAVGNPGAGVWGGHKTRLVSMYFEWSRLNGVSSAHNAVRSDVLDKTLIWLLGRARPQVTVTSPNGGELVTTSTVSITWTSSTAPGTSVANRRIEYSLDGGSSWILLDPSAPGPNSYNWDLTSVPNSATVKVRVAISDDGAPPLSASDESNATFSIQRSGGDIEGPVVTAGSMRTVPNPIVRGNSATLYATVTDHENGDGTVAQAEWSHGAAPAAAGAGTAMSGAFGTLAVDVAAALTTSGYVAGSHTFWVRGRDTAGNWGPAAAFNVEVIGNAPVGVDDGPVVNFLGNPRPNPSQGSTALRFGMVKSGHVDLAVYDMQGRKIRGLIGGERTAGNHSVVWDGRDDQGLRVRPGIYPVRLVTPAGTFRTRIVAIN